MKNIYFLFALLLFICSCIKSKSFSIKINGMTKIDGTKVDLFDKESKVIYASTTVNRNQFSLNINSINEGFYLLRFTNSERIGQITGWIRELVIYLEKDKFYSLTIKDKNKFLDGEDDFAIQSNSVNQKKLDEFRIDLKSYYDSLLSEQNRLITLRDASNYDDPLYTRYHDSLLSIRGLLIDSYRTIVHRYIRKNNETVVVPYLVNKMNDLFENYLIYSKAINNLSPQYSSHPETILAQQKLKAASKLYIGGILPHIYGVDDQNNPVKYNFSSKKITLIDFWASWCFPCRTANLKLKEIYKKHEKMGLGIISVSMDNDLQKWRSALIQDKLPWLNVCEGEMPSKSENYKSFNTSSLPLNFLVDHRKVIIAKNIDLDSLDLMLEKL
jgi:thiol-disulfide isomerase/thioredoxin